MIISRCVLQKCALKFDYVLRDQITIQIPDKLISVDFESITQELVNNVYIYTLPGIPTCSIIVC